MTKAEITKTIKAHDVYVLIDRLVVKQFDEDDIHRISDSIGTAFYEGEGMLWVEQNDTILKTFNNKFTLDGIESIVKFKIVSDLLFVLTSSKNVYIYSAQNMKL